MNNTDGSLMIDCRGELGRITEVWITGQRFVPIPAANGDAEVVCVPGFYRVTRLTAGTHHHFLLNQSEVDALCHFRASEIVAAGITEQEENSLAITGGDIACDHDWTASFEGGDTQRCRKCGAFRDITED